MWSSSFQTFDVLHELSTAIVASSPTANIFTRRRADCILNTTARNFLRGVLREVEEDVCIDITALLSGNVLHHAQSDASDAHIHDAISASTHVFFSFLF